MMFKPCSKVVSKIALLLMTSISAIGPTRTALAAISGSDDFNDNSKDPAKWATDIPSGNGILTEINQRLQYTCSPATDEDIAVRPWLLNKAAYNTDWEVRLDLHNAATPPSINQVTSIGIEVLAANNFANFVDLELYASTLDMPQLRRGFQAVLAVNNNDIGQNDTLDLGVTDGAIRIVFDSQTKVFTFFYDSNGSADGYVWTQLASFGINGSGGTTANGSWGLSGSQAFELAIYGFDSNIAVSSGQMYADNFSAQTAPTTSPVVTNWVSGDTLVMSWPQSALNYSLQESSVLDSNSWSSAAQSPVLSNGFYSVAVPMTGSGRFFRLKR